MMPKKEFHGVCLPIGKNNIIHFAAYKNHIGLYPGDKAIEYFVEQLKEYKTSKGAVQSPYKKPIPLEYC